jgi:glycosyltransferase 2 family protein
MQEQEVRSRFSRRKILIPVLLGLAVACWLLWGTLSEVRYYEVPAGSGQYTWSDGNSNKVIDFGSDEDFSPSENGNYSKETFTEALVNIEWTWFSTFAIFMALIMMVVRDFCYMWRIRILTDKELSWRQSFHVIMIWEFASAMTPGIVGGAAVAMFILNREKISLGRATSLVMITAMLDELFYILIVPVMVLIVGTATMFPAELTSQLFGKETSVIGIFWLAIILISLVTILLFIAVFVAPVAFKKLLLFFCKLPFLKKLRIKAEKTGDDIILTSHELRGKPFSFWIQAFLATAFSWTGRFLVINFLILAFSPYADQFVIFARQLSMWVILLISPTPGGSGIAEFAFSGFLSEFIPFGLAGILALIWRVISYYPYLFFGAVILPAWLQKTRNSSAHSVQND